MQETTNFDPAFLADLAAIRRDIHAHPELAFSRTRTPTSLRPNWRNTASRSIAASRDRRRRRHPLRPISSSPRMVGLRADMDALPLKEMNEFPHRSSTRAACTPVVTTGHTTMLLGAARYIAEHRDEIGFDGTVVFIFQPAEESEGAARR